MYDEQENDYIQILSLASNRKDILFGKFLQGEALWEEFMFG